MSALSSNDVKQLSQILHSTSKSLGRPSNLAAKREMLSRLLGFNDWNGACAMLPNHMPDNTHVGIALLEVPSAPPKTFIATGFDAPWRLPDKVRNHLTKHSLNPAGFTVPSCSRPDPEGDSKPRYWSFAIALTPGSSTEHKVPFGPHTPDYSRLDHTPTVMTFANAQGRVDFTLTVWWITLHPGTGTVTNFTGAMSRPLSHTFIESITGRVPDLRQAYCLVNSRQAGFANAVVRCNEMGSELEIVKHLPYMTEDEAWAQLAPYNNVLGLSLLDVADITDACFSADNEDIGETW
jgi:hypothetical protein